MVYNALDLTVLLQMSDGNSCETAVDFQPLDKDGLADEPEGGDFLDNAVVRGLVEGDGMDSLVLDLALGPLLLLRCLSTA